MKTFHFIVKSLLLIRRVGGLMSSLNCQRKILHLIYPPCRRLLVPPTPQPPPPDTYPPCRRLFSCRRITVICLNRPLGGLMIRKLHENISKSLIRPEGGLMKKEKNPKTCHVFIRPVGGFMNRKSSVG